MHMTFVFMLRADNLNTCVYPDVDIRAKVYVYVTGMHACQHMPAFIYVYVPTYTYTFISILTYSHVTL